MASPSRLTLAARTPRIASAESRDAPFALLDIPSCVLDRIASFGRRAELASRRTPRAREARRTTTRRSAAAVGDCLQPPLDVLERAGLGVERCDEAVEIAADLTQPDGEVAQLLCRAPQLGRDALEWSKSPFGEGGERSRTLAFVRRQSRCCG